jgi:hypothetical protein
MTIDKQAVREAILFAKCNLSDWNDFDNQKPAGDKPLIKKQIDRWHTILQCLEAQL